MSEPLYYAEGRNIHKRPIEKKAANGERLIALGFRCATADENVGEEGAQAIAELMNLGDADTIAKALEAEAARLDDDATAVHNGTMRGDMKLRAKAFRDAAKIARAAAEA